MAASIIGQFKMCFHLQPRAFYEICHCYHRQCGEERSLHLLRSCLAGCVRCLSEVCPHLQCLDGCSLSETLHLQRESIGLWQCFHRRCGQGHPCVQRLAECDQLPQVCSSLLPCQDYWSPQWIWEFYSLVQDVLQLYGLQLYSWYFGIRLSQHHHCSKDHGLHPRRECSAVNARLLHHVWRHLLHWSDGLSQEEEECSK